MDRELILVLIGAGAAIIGGVIGGWIQGRAWFHYERKRANLESTERWARLALDWSKSGRNQSFRGADLHGSNLTGVDLSEDESGIGVDMSWANLEEARFSGSVLHGAKLSFTRVFHTDFAWAEMTKADLTRANVIKFDWNTGKPPNISGMLRVMTLSLLISLPRSFVRRVRRTWLGPLTFSADFANANLDQSNLRRAWLVGANLYRAKLNLAQIDGASLRSAYLVEANLYGADLSGADLAFADLTRANLMSTDLSACNLEGADLTGAQMEGAVYDRSTKWPRNFDPSTTGAGLVTEVSDSGHLDNKAESTEVVDPGHDET
jgi:uncharacterized protein YjbI with pentapeptide repeats